MSTCIVLFSFLLLYGIVQGSHRSFKLDSSESSLLKGKTIDVSESPPVNSSIAEEFSSSSVTSRLLSGLTSNDDDGGPRARVVVFVILVVLLAGIVIVLIWFIFRNQRRGNDQDERATTQSSSIPTTQKGTMKTKALPHNNERATTQSSSVPVPVLVVPSANPHGGVATVAGPSAAPIVDILNTKARRNKAAAAARVFDSPETLKLSLRPSRGADFGPNSYSYKELQHATSNFSAANIIGEGAFAKVYKGCLSDKTKVAVKVFKNENTAGDEDFKHEVNVISRAKHRNIVRLLGYCIDDTKRCIVYEFVENRSLEYHLLGGEGIKTLEWPIRMKIAKDTAKGIAYLHDECPQSIIHRDVKPANILLGLEFVAKVADFGIAKLCPEYFTSLIASRVIGTFGYVDPVYVETKELTFKSDVYSFGVVLLQLVSAVTDLPKLQKLREVQLPIALKSGNFHCIADLKLDKKYVRDEMALMLTCAEACLRKDREDRPAMSQVFRVLEGIVSADELKIRNIRKRGV